MRLTVLVDYAFITQQVKGLSRWPFRRVFFGEMTWKSLDAYTGGIPDADATDTECRGLVLIEENGLLPGSDFG